jgi:hypothetical protein
MDQDRTADVEKRVTQLQVVFNKALNESVNGVSPAEIGECCGSVKNQISVGSVQKAYVDMIGESQTKMDEAFNKICELRNVEEVIRKSMGINSSTDVADISNIEGSFNEIINEEKRREKERLAEAITQLDSDVKRQREVLHRLKAQIQNEIAAATEECQKMAAAAAQIGNKQKQ